MSIDGHGDAGDDAGGDAGNDASTVASTGGDTVAAWVRAGLLGPAEEAAMEVIRRRLEEEDELVLLAIGLVVLAQRFGHSCVDLDALGPFAAEAMAEHGTDGPPPGLPTADDLRARLVQCDRVVRVVDSEAPGTSDEAIADRRPLVLMGNLVYAQRQFADELSIAHQVARRARSATHGAIDTALIDRALPVPAPADTGSDGALDPGIANRAAVSVATRELTVLTGGPGTGKTYTLTRCLAALLSAREAELDSLDIAVVAPTGKAAARAKDLIAAFVAEQRGAGDDALGLSPAVLDRMGALLPGTIHSLLARRAGMQTRFAHDAARPLPHDVVIVDEMSMVPTFLMARLLEAIRPGATVLLVGDQAQLESVESGSVLRGIVDAATARSAADTGVFELVRVFRQDDSTQIGDLARLIRAGSSDEVATVERGAFRGVSFVPHAANRAVDLAVLTDVVEAMREVKRLATSTDPADHRAAFALNLRHKVLCGPRSGPTGVAALNSVIAAAVQGPLAGGFVQPGTPLLVTVNDPRTRLVNGDIGVVVTMHDTIRATIRDNMRDTDARTALRVFFPDGDGGRYLALAELPAVEISYAMTIHKSQGSEYDDLMVFLPAADSPLLTRELVYTAVTRARSSLTLVGSIDALGAAVRNPSHRMSGLAAMIDSLSTP